VPYVHDVSSSLKADLVAQAITATFLQPGTTLASDAESAERVDSAA
jgi:hypothetical protein